MSDLGLGHLQNISQMKTMFMIICFHCISIIEKERQKDRKTERQKDRKTERQKDRKTERQCVSYSDESVRFTIII
jgi:hypothetical protein